MNFNSYAKLILLVLSAFVVGDQAFAGGCCRCVPQGLNACARVSKYVNNTNRTTKSLQSLKNIEMAYNRVRTGKWVNGAWIKIEYTPGNFKMFAGCVAADSAVHIRRTDNISCSREVQDKLHQLPDPDESIGCAMEELRKYETGLDQANGVQLGTTAMARKRSFHKFMGAGWCDSRDPLTPFKPDGTNLYQVGTVNNSIKYTCSDDKGNLPGGCSGYPSWPTIEWDGVNPLGANQSTGGSRRDR